MEEAAFTWGDLTELGMAHSRSIASRSGRTWSGYPGQAANGQRHSLGLAHRCALARHARAIRKLEFGLHTLRALEQSPVSGTRLSRHWRALGRPPTQSIPELHDRAGAPACSWRKRGNQNQEALGRSRGGFLTKIHLRTNTKGDPLTFDVTGGEVHEVKGYDALMELHDVNPDNSSATRATTATKFATI